MKRTATLLGATGLIGGHILDFLKKDSAFDEVRIIVRRPLKIDHPKVKVVVIDFEDEAQFKSAMEGSDVVFCAIGTTQKKVKGDKKLYRTIDFDIPVNAAKHSIKYGCKQFLIVSSLGADSKKKGFYLKLKGEVEDALKEKVHSPVGFDSLSIFRPSLLLGDRSESRIAEGIGQFFSKALKFLIPGNYKPIEGKDVAKAMVEVAKLDKKGVEIYHYEEMEGLIKNEK
ncbi:NAD-dependent epimerase/dehydratase family protein [Brumimicrobium glaciale]|uniref:NAD-dependent epimerase/dehydratase family protein n=1 Tax=Brumimicrobium glaciale TaxID=200475 RepID=A0A4Q4KQH1_9FLAO|nr:NAD(P)H-binding protein [Brumimicrobium glaciale]RYM35657.1 NAD-dependent epimerase/dehydratase family protein [Brumimicrobium glaciale]